MKLYYYIKGSLEERLFEGLEERWEETSNRKHSKCWWDTNYSLSITLMAAYLVRKLEEVGYVFGKKYLISIDALEAKARGLPLKIAQWSSYMGLK